MIYFLRAWLFGLLLGAFLLQRDHAPHEHAPSIAIVLTCWPEDGEWQCQA